MASSRSPDTSPVVRRGLPECRHLCRRLRGSCNQFPSTKLINWRDRLRLLFFPEPHALTTDRSALLIKVEERVMASTPRPHCETCLIPMVAVQLNNRGPGVEYWRCPTCGTVTATGETHQGEPSARTHCPDCKDHGGNVVDLANLLRSERVDYFRCRACGCWWIVPKGAHGPATRAVFGSPEASAKAKEAS